MDKSGWLLGGIVGAILYIVISMFNDAKACDVEQAQQDAVVEYHDALVYMTQKTCAQAKAHTQDQEGTDVYVRFSTEDDTVHVVVQCLPQ